MDIRGQIHELDTIVKEYEQFFDVIELVIKVPSSDTSFNSNDLYPNISSQKLSSDDNYIIINTYENQIIKISVNYKGWYQIDDGSKVIPNSERSYYETFEALMNLISPEFNLRFTNSLTTKLSNLLDIQLKLKSDGNNF